MNDSLQTNTEKEIAPPDGIWIIDWGNPTDMTLNLNVKGQIY